MAAAFTMILFILHAFAASVLQVDSIQVLPKQQPHLTGCVSTNMETFCCRWNVGTFQNLSEPGELRLFYIKTDPPTAYPTDWRECPHYSTERPNECFFDENHTSIWRYYNVQLRSRDQSVLYDEILFHVEDIVQPDPPVSLNWTLLNESLTGSYYDILLSWKPPQSADVGRGWMTLQFEVQYRSVSSDQWKVADLVKSTHRSLYGLQTNINHEVRIRSKMFGGTNFGDFSNSVFINIPSRISRFPGMIFLIIGTLCLLAIVLLAIISQQQKLMFILLPPVPGPKIRGIDPDLLKEITEINGKNSMLKIMLGDANRMMKFYLTKEKSLVEEKDGLIITVKRLQQTLQEQSDLRVENERLKNDIVDLKQQNERTVEWKRKMQK